MVAERIVVDSSYLIEAVHPTHEEWRLDALYLINAIAIGDIKALCPNLLQLEIAAVCRRKVRNTAAQRMFELLESLALEVDVNLSTARGLYNFARDIKCQVYDGVYLDLAKLYKLPIATRDNGQITACRTLRLPIWHPPKRAA
jgi:predicted nucleic acid-binding protein